MSRRAFPLLVLSACVAGSALAQAPQTDAVVPDPGQPAPIERRYADPPPPPPPPALGQEAPREHRRHEPTVSQPIEGLYIVSDHRLLPAQGAGSDGKTTELRLEHGRADIRVDHPASDELILIDLPGGQVDLLKDGFYTLNADTNTVRVLHGEADLFAPGAGSGATPVKLHEHEQAVLADGFHPVAIPEGQERADLIPPPAYRGEGGAPQGPQQGYGYGAYAGNGGYGYEAYPGYGYGAYPGYGYGAYPGYGYGPYGYYAPYAYGYPYWYGGWGYPYYGYYGWPYGGWGWPYMGFGWGGFGWGGGWYGRGGYGHGFPGGVYHGGAAGGFHGGASGGFHGGGGGRR